MATPRSISIGSNLGPYRIEALLGAGGMGVVYLAHDAELRRNVAIKFVERTRYSAEAAQLLLREARVVAALNHPSICGVHEIGHDGDEPFIVMEHVRGTPLCDLLARDRSLPIETAIHYTVQIVDALAHAHQHGIVHGDLKTSNVMVEADGRIKLLDFGLAVKRIDPALESDDVTTKPDDGASGAGTVPYMAPELLRGRRADERSDIWAVGVVLFEMLAGNRPFRGTTTWEVAAAILTDPPGPLPAGTPGGIRTVVARCLARRPPDRYRTARELASALDDVR